MCYGDARSDRADAQSIMEEHPVVSGGTDGDSPLGGSSSGEEALPNQADAGAGHEVAQHFEAKDAPPLIKTVLTNDSDYSEAVTSLVGEFLVNDLPTTDGPEVVDPTTAAEYEEEAETEILAEFSRDEETDMDSQGSKVKSIEDADVLIGACAQQMVFEGAREKCLDSESNAQPDFLSSDEESETSTEETALPVQNKQSVPSKEIDTEESAPPSAPFNVPASEAPASAPSFDSDKSQTVSEALGVLNSFVATQNATIVATTPNESKESPYFSFPRNEKHEEGNVVSDDNRKVTSDLDLASDTTEETEVQIQKTHFPEKNSIESDHPLSADAEANTGQFLAGSDEIVKLETQHDGHTSERPDEPSMVDAKEGKDQSEDQFIVIDDTDDKPRSAPLPVVDDSVSSQPPPRDTVVPDGNAPFAMGDHVYQWRSFALVPSMFQHHGIVLHVTTSGEDGWVLKIADYTRDSSVDEMKGDRSGYAAGGDKRSISSEPDTATPIGCLRVYETSSKDWHKVRYGASRWDQTTSRSGTCTAASCDPPGMVRARMQFLLDHPETLPSYDIVRSNCECVAVWAKTGTWGTLQAASWLAITAAGQAKSAVTVAGVAASTQVTVPAAGLWGMLGYTTQASFLSMHPIAVPLIAAYGVVTAGVPAVSLLRCKKQWREQTELLNQKFWEDALRNPDAFADSLTHWSSLHEPEESR